MNLLEFSCRLRYPSGFQLDAAFNAERRVTAICGPSGSGKTSVLSIIAGLRRPDMGRVRLGSRVLEDTAAKIRLAPESRRIGYVFQDDLLFPHLNIRRNLQYGWQRRPLTLPSPPGGEGGVRGRRPDGTNTMDFDRVVQVLELGDMLNRFPHSLSGGQRRRVALGRALLRGPELLLLDEPMASLDASLKDRVLGYVEKALEEWQIPTLYVTHDLAEVKRVAEWVVILERGKVKFAGALAESIGK